MATEDEKLMRRALVLARRGLGKVEPNPMVGAILVKSGQIIGKGWHRQFGEAHAEINALRDCAGLGADPRGATLYVTLEPCCHEGKTGPCTAALKEAGLRKIVAATRDPSEHGNGAGFQQLRDAGMEVEIGCCQREARLLNAPFFQFAGREKTWVILKWAQTLDSYLASNSSSEEENRWISNKQSRSDVHRLRRRTQAILVGINTVIEDNPRLTPRPSQGRNPLRVILDTSLRVPLTSRLLCSAKRHPTLIVTSAMTYANKKARVKSIQKKGADVLACPNGANRIELDYVLNHLFNDSIQQLLVEGGPTIHAAFLQAGLMNELYIYLTPRFFGSRGSANFSQAIQYHGCDVKLDDISIKVFANDVRWRGLNTHSIQSILAL